MDEIISKELKKSIHTGFINFAVNSQVLYQPKLLVNSKSPPQKVLTTIIQEFNKCERFFISVAFLTTDGVATLINCLKALESKGVKGKVIVSQYLNFTQPEALKKLLKFKNIELKITVTGNSHSKGYIFEYSNHTNLIIGSSNLTASALATNKEWNLKVSALNTSGIVKNVLAEFNQSFKSGVSVTKDYISQYEELYKKQNIFYQGRDVIQSIDLEITPNSMQIEALENLETLRKGNKNKALVISATGTGKTFLSAFDVKSFKPQKLLFVVHRRSIAQKSMDSFKAIFGNKISMGLYSGQDRELENDFIFSTVQTISKQNHLERFNKSHFDYIIIDESHRSGANSYQNLIDYFNPKFLLGMTATPERTDGYDIFSIFDHNIAYEIRLNRAMDEDMLSPFHYYGIADLAVDEIKLEGKSDFNKLTSGERVNKIIENVNFYGTDNGVTRGLVFCSGNKESKELSLLFNKKGFKTISLSGENSEQERVDAITKLESDDLNEKLDYIFTVDIFNEGIDIPKVNQIIMVRPTESAIIFVQQLGRGLRKYDSKYYLTVLDFIGNYKNNYLIPIALYGDTSYNKDKLRKLISEGSALIPGSSTVNFDEITKERIFKSIESANMQLLADLKKDYTLLKYKLGRMPMMIDFIEHGSRDPFLYVENSKSYFNFVKIVEKDFVCNLNTNQIKLLELFSKEINNSKRVEECIILYSLILNEFLSESRLKEIINEKYGYKISKETIDSCVLNLNFDFIREKQSGKLISARKKYKLNIIQYKNNVLTLCLEFQNELSNSLFKAFLLDSINYSIMIFNKNFSLDSWNNGFLLYNKYSRKDVFRILNFTENPVAQNVGGYLVSKDNKYCPIFVNYHKDEDISESTKYEDEFINNMEFDWMSKSNRKLQSNDVQSIIGANGNIRLPLFIKKNNDEGVEFYYMGDLTPNKNHIKESTMNSDSGKKVSVVKIRFNLENPVSESMYEYLTTSLKNSNTSQQSKATNLDERSKASETIIQDNIVQLHNPVPLYDFYAAAGSFSEMQHNRDYKEIELPEKYKSNKDFFACRIIGESMNRIIPNGSICLFKKYRDGSRNNKIVLVENYNNNDSDFNSAFTIKTYISEKIVSEGSWEHSSITLKPNSYDKSYQNIILDEDSASEMRVLGIFVQVLD